MKTTALCGVKCSTRFRKFAGPRYACRENPDQSNLQTLKPKQSRHTLFRFSWKWSRRSPSKVIERTYEEATEALHTGRESRHPEAAFAGQGTHPEASKELFTDKEPISKLLRNSISL